MRKELELSDPNSCLNRAKDGELVFTLLGRDKAFPATLRFWISERIRLGKNKINDQQIISAMCDANVVELMQHEGDLPLPLHWLNRIRWQPGQRLRSRKPEAHGDSVVLAVELVTYADPYWQGLVYTLETFVWRNRMRLTEDEVRELFVTEVEDLAPIHIFRDNNNARLSTGNTDFNDPEATLHIPDKDESCQTPTEPS